jgi:hypothetical protein
VAGVELGFRAACPGPLGLDGLLVGGRQPGEVPVPVRALPFGVLPQLPAGILQPGACRFGLGAGRRELRGRLGEP